MGREKMGRERKEGKGKDGKGKERRNGKEREVAVYTTSWGVQFWATAKVVGRGERGRERKKDSATIF